MPNKIGSHAYKFLYLRDKKRVVDIQKYISVTRQHVMSFIALL